ncbi:GTPase Grn1 [Schizosaccharomyces cryophilus OY26]|uniref:GTPase Grn1 n=1 Tax=Schizosaccharomyces cryophilus (strain OY26 / ATCC MYA-4695 / CBS 11777 / NBRC 106824 / NRRL Y48691) TaxID=653667 RepID=S9XIX5_SCHCR|nr:GTPase Grn1 [Schizosaccharomyces cryophilus OY26]EPY53581.1 GTPase Grn1 [Schizosaccharomyces cryophilus OY26]
MVSIRKKSKRRTTRLRARIEKRAASSRRKERKLEKKNPQWKSRIPKDPGIPNSFPYKDRILADIEAQKRQREEEKIARKEAAKSEGDMDSDEDSEMEEERADGVDPMIAKIAEAAQARDSEEQQAEEEDGVIMDEDDDDNTPSLVEDDSPNTSERIVKGDTSRKAFDKEFKKAVELSDIVLYVLDARDPEGTRSKEVEQQVVASAAEEKRLVYVVNKIDLVPPEVLDRWLVYLRAHFPTLPLRSSSGSSGFKHKTYSANGTISALLKSLKSYSSKKKLKSSLTVSVIGYPNVGKSSVINALVNRSAVSRSTPCPAGSAAGMTRSLREVKLDSKLRLIDSPGIVFPTASKEDEHYRLVLLNAIPSSKIDDPVPAAAYILNYLNRIPGLLERMLSQYELPPLLNTSELDTATDFLVNIARKRGRLSRGGIPNLNAAASIIVNDWHAGHIQWWAEPETTTKETSASDDKQVVSQWAKEFDINEL